MRTTRNRVLLVVVGAVLALGATPASAEDFGGETLVDTDIAHLPVIDPVRQAVKDQQEQEALPLTTALVAANVLAAEPATAAVMPGPCQAPCTSYPASAVARATQYPQETPCYCVPATGKVILSAVMSPPSQSSLAASMGTRNGTPGSDACGTPTKNLVNELNRYQSRNYYQYSVDTASPQHLLNRVAVDVYRYGMSLEMSVEGEFVPWWPEGWTGKHATTAYGYWTQNGSGLYVYDSLNSGNVAGPHRASTTVLYQANTANGKKLVW